VTYNFISGLPRSGSTLLASILSQNAAFHASIISPMGPVVTAIRGAFSPGQETHIMWTDEQHGAVIEAVFDAYYEKDLDKVIFDSNRRWCADASMLAMTFPRSRIICCVREPTHIVDSFERMFRHSPMVASTIIQSDVHATVYQRVQILMQPMGVVGYALNAFRDAYYGPQADRLFIMEYMDLAQHPRDSMVLLHNWLGLKWFEYDFNNIKPIPGADEFDRSIGLPGLHNLKSQVTLEPRKTVLPPDIIAGMPAAFWRVNESVTQMP
jgi:sulfotransferase